MRAILHIGTEKTGSTTIQAFIRKNLRHFRSHGIEFLTFPGHHTSRPFVTWALDSDHEEEEVAKLGLSELAKREAWRENFKAEITERLSKLPDNIHTVLFSSEHFQSRLTSESEVHRLKEMLDEFFDEYLVLLYLRRQDDVARSLYSTSLRTGQVPKRQLLAGNMNGPYFNYLELMRRWVKEFGRDAVEVHKYGREFFRDGDLLVDFCDVCGIEDISQFGRPTEKNKALSAVAQAALLELNLHFPGKVDGKVNEFNRLLRRKCQKYLIRNYPGKTLSPSRAEAIDFYENFREQNEQMYEEFFDGVPIFKTGFDHYPEESVDLLEVDGHREALLEAIRAFQRKMMLNRRSQSGWMKKLEGLWARIRGEE